MLRFAQLAVGLSARLRPRRLDELRDRGLLTQSEHAEQRARILADL